VPYFLGKRADNDGIEGRTTEQDCTKYLREVEAVKKERKLEEGQFVPAQASRAGGQGFEATLALHQMASSPSSDGRATCARAHLRSETV
jgi:hypothetical protein